MASAPYGVRLLIGAATVAVEETKKLPQTILTYPMTLASQAAHLIMLWQQSLAELVNKGDSTLEALFPPKDEQPEWATFDEDLGGDGAAADPGDAGLGRPLGNPDGPSRSGGRFALYSAGEPAAPGNETNATPAPTSAASAPPIATEIDYRTLTLAQLRARLNSLSVDELEALLSYEEATKARAPFQTLLSNRIARATAK